MRIIRSRSACACCPLTHSLTHTHALLLLRLLRSSTRQKGLFPPPHSAKGRGSRGGANSGATTVRTATGASRVRTIRPVTTMEGTNTLVSPPLLLAIVGRSAALIRVRLTVEGIVPPLAFELAALGGSSVSVSPPRDPLVPAPVAASTRHRQNLRSRSNSMPVSFTSTSAVASLVVVPFAHRSSCSVCPTSANTGARQADVDVE